MKSRFKDLPHSFLSNTKSNFSQNEASKSGLEATEINKLKAQINMLARSRFRNKESEVKAENQTDRQFTFQDDEKKQSAKRHSNSSNVPKKPTKKL